MRENGVFSIGINVSSFHLKRKQFYVDECTFSFDFEFGVNRGDSLHNLR
jgi:hypothetical protein